MEKQESLQSSLQHRSVRVLKCEIIAGDALQEHDRSVSYETGLGYDLKAVIPADQTSIAEDYFFCTMILQIDGKAVLEKKTQYEVHYLACCELRCSKEGITEKEFLSMAETSGLITLISNARAQIQGISAILGYINPYVFPLLNIAAVIKDHREALKANSDQL